MSIKSQVESLIFISNYPLTTKKLCDLTGAKKEDIENAVDELKKEYDARGDSGIILSRIGDKIQLATHGASAQAVQNFIKEETTGELTRASLETLTIIAYRGPVTRAEIEQIRGVNCAIILRNLMMRGLAEAREDKKKMETYYAISFDFLRFLGISETQELPDYEKLNSAENLKKILEEKIAASE